MDLKAFCLSLASQELENFYFSALIEFPFGPRGEGTWYLEMGLRYRQLAGTTEQQLAELQPQKRAPYFER